MDNEKLVQEIESETDKAILKKAAERLIFTGSVFENWPLSVFEVRHRPQRSLFAGFLTNIEFRSQKLLQPPR